MEGREAYERLPEWAYRTRLLSLVAYGDTDQSCAVDISTARNPTHEKVLLHSSHMLMISQRLVSLDRLIRQLRLIT